MKGHLSMAKDIVLTGKFEGDLQTLGCLTVASGGVVTGSIEAGSLISGAGQSGGGQDQGRSQPGSGRRLPRKVSKKTPGGDKWSGRLKKLKEMALGRK